MNDKTRKDKWEKPEIKSMELKLTGGKFDNGGSEVPQESLGQDLLGQVLKNINKFTKLYFKTRVHILFLPFKKTLIVLWNGNYLTLFLGFAQFIFSIQRRLKNIFCIL